MKFLKKLYDTHKVVINGITLFFWLFSSIIGIIFLNQALLIATLLVGIILFVANEIVANFSKAQNSKENIKNTDCDETSSKSYLQLLNKFKAALPEVEVNLVTIENGTQAIIMTPPETACGESEKSHIEEVKKNLKSRHWSFIEFGKKTWFNFKKDPSTGKYVEAQFAYGGRKFVPLTKYSTLILHGMQVGMKEPNLIVEPEPGTTTDQVRVTPYV